MSYNDILQIMGEKIDRLPDKSSVEFSRGVLAGFYIAFGCIFMGMAKTAGFNSLICAITFSLGLFLVVCCNGELFTGNCLLITYIFEKDDKHVAPILIHNYISNFMGIIIMILLVSASGIDLTVFGDIAAAKCNMSVNEALIKSVFCNMLVCLGVWIATYSGFSKSAASKFIAVAIPVTAFIFCGFEHSIANMFFLPFGVIFQKISILQALGHLVVTTLGNYLGGALIALYLANSYEKISEKD